MKRVQSSSVQDQRFEKFSKEVLQDSDYYRRFVGKSLREFPVINKAIHMEYFNSINTIGAKRDEALEIAIEAENTRQFKQKYHGCSVGLSSGTSGNRGLFLVSDLERAEWAGFIIGKMLPFSLRKHRIAFFLRANNNLYETVKSPFIDFRFFDLIEPFDKHLSQLNQFKPEILIAPAQVLKRLSVALSSKLDIQPRKIISVAEVLDEHDKAFIEAAFEQKVHQVYQCTEGLLACTCKHGRLHLNEELLIVEKEWIDPDSRRFVPVITDLRRRSQPIIRYRLDDILIEDAQGCECGLKTTVLKKVEGRCDDALILRNYSGNKAWVYPDFVRNRIISVAARISDYRVIQETENRLEIQLSPNVVEYQLQISKGLEDLWERLRIYPPECYFSELTDTDPTEKKRRVQRCIDGQVSDNRS